MSGAPAVAVRRLGLRAKLLWGLVALLLCMGIVTTAMLAKLQLDRFRIDERRQTGLMEETVWAKAQELASAHADAVRILAADNALGDIQRLVAGTVEHDEDVVYGAFIKPTGVALAYSSSEHPEGASDPRLAVSHLEIGPEVLQRREPGRRARERQERPVIEFTAPVLDHEQLIGTLVYGVSAARAHQELVAARAQHRQELRASLWQMVGIIALVTLVAVSVVSPGARRLTQPIVRLTEAAQALAKGQRGVRVEIGSGDEIEALGASFNAMVVELDRSYAELSRSHGQLLSEMEERKRAEAERELAQRELFQAQKLEAIGQLAGGVAHDFNNLLAAVQGHAELLEAMPLPTESVDHLRAIRQAVTHGVGLTRQLLAFGRRQENEPRVVEPDLVVRELRSLLGRLLKPPVELVLEIDPGTPAVFVDPCRLEQVLMNLVVNARDALPGRGTIRIITRERTVTVSTPTANGTAPPGRYLELVVEDDGVGIAVAARPHIFEPFFTTKEAGKGTGLGLATVYGIVGQAKGYLEVESEPGRGTRLGVLLPVVARVEAASDSAPVPTLPPGDDREILLCEDEAVTRDVVVRILRSGGYRVTAFGSAAELVASLTTRLDAPSLLVTDVIMPELNGVELARAVSERFPALPVLYVSGYTAGLLAEQGIDGVSASLLHKPFTRQELLGSVAELLRGAAQTTAVA